MLPRRLQANAVFGIRRIPMRRLWIALIVIVSLNAISCTTADGNVFPSQDRTAALMEALSGSVPVTDSDSAGIPQPEIVVPVVRKSTEKKEEPPKEEKAVEAAVPEDAVEEPAPEGDPVQESAAAPAAEQPAEAVDPLPELDNEAEAVMTFTVPEEEAEPASVPDDAGLPAPKPYIVNYESDDDESQLLLPALMNGQMKPWMIRLMVILAVVIVFFTVATAIRNAIGLPLPRLVSAVAALLMAAVPAAVSYLAFGYSELWAVYLVLLFSYFVFRSGSGKRGSR